ncbi:unnamed protein product [Meloidogyne enterolobii]|uniref:Uncharacterized protein n=1 Tax=Meloidogyne enterolobii TaxID=390850 RepID=A0ACB0ZTH9_MELEN
MQKLLALLLGAAVQSPQRERFIERIKHMRPEVQSELVEEIQRVTSNSTNTNSPVVNLDSLLAELEQQPSSASTDEEAADKTTEEGIESNNQRVVTLLERVIRERDEFTNELFEMAADMEQEGSSGSSSSGMATASSSCNGDISVLNNNKCVSNNGARSPSPNALDRHLSVELAAAKGELRKLRNENDEKDEILQEMQDELQQQRIEIGRLQAERLELVKDARAAKDYRDEMDCMQHKLNRLERLEAENEKLRSRLNEMDYYKNRANHLKEDNKIMHETNQVMEEQLEQYQKKISAHLEVETKLIEAQGNVKSLQLDMTKTRERIEELLLENGRLERELRVNRQKCSELERQICSLTEFDSPRIGLDNCNGSNTSLFNESSLLAQLEAHNQSQILELQLDNKKLKAQLENKERNSKSANPAELFEIRKELAEKEKILTEKDENIKNLFIKLETANKKVEENTERFQKEQQNVEKLKHQLVEFKRTNVPLKTHQTLMERLEGVEQKNQELERHLTVEKEQYELIKDEKDEVENQLQKMCIQQRDIRAELDSIKEKHQTEINLWEKQKKSFEAEKSALKIRLELLESKEQALIVAEQNAENLTRKLVDLQKDLAQSEAKREFSVEELEKEKQKLNAEIRKGQRFREELATERGRLRDLLERLRSGKLYFGVQIIFINLRQR